MLSLQAVQKQVASPGSLVPSLSMAVNEEGEGISRCEGNPHTTIPRPPPEGIQEAGTCLSPLFPAALRATASFETSVGACTLNAHM